MRRFVPLVLAALLAAPLTATAAVLPQDDAGSGRDAPDVATPSFQIDPGVVYEGTIEGIGTDYQD